MSVSSRHLGGSCRSHSDRTKSCHGAGIRDQLGEKLNDPDYSSAVPWNTSGLPDHVGSAVRQENGIAASTARQGKVCTPVEGSCCDDVAGSHICCPPGGRVGSAAQETHAEMVLSAAGPPDQGQRWPPGLLYAFPPLRLMLPLLYRVRAQKSPGTRWFPTLEALTVEGPWSILDVPGALVQAGGTLRSRPLVGRPLMVCKLRG